MQGIVRPSACLQTPRHVQHAVPTLNSRRLSSNSCCRVCQTPVFASQSLRGSLLAHASKSHTYNVEVEVTEEDSPDEALKQFRFQCREAGIVNDVRRRRFFETPQDIVKRKTKEKHLRKKYEKKFKRNMTTFADSEFGEDEPPFDNIFKDEEEELNNPLFESGDNQNGMASPRQLQRRDSRAPQLGDEYSRTPRERSKPDFRRPTNLPQ